jgi:tetratricopeptide (TPR) repeat protein
MGGDASAVRFVCSGSGRAGRASWRSGRGLSRGLKEYTRERVPLQWAGTQMNLGGALRMLGQRESGTGKLEEAVAAYRGLSRGAKGIYARACAAPMGGDADESRRCASNARGVRAGRRALRRRRGLSRRAGGMDARARSAPMGDDADESRHALERLGSGRAGRASWEEAVATYRAALEEYTPERVPLDWRRCRTISAMRLQRSGARERDGEAHGATMQNNLGNAFRLGERESGTGKLTEAVAAYRAALEERTRDRVPLDWATTQNNLGTLRTLGERESGTARLEEAVAACREALKEYTPQTHAWTTKAQ